MQTIVLESHFQLIQSVWFIYGILQLYLLIDSCYFNSDHDSSHNNQTMSVNLIESELYLL